MQTQCRIIYTSACTHPLLHPQVIRLLYADGHLGLWTENSSKMYRDVLGDTASTEDLLTPANLGFLVKQSPIGWEYTFVDISAQAVYL
jgi:hypothetical protein